MHCCESPLISDLVSRVEVRFLPGEYIPESDVIDEYIKTITDRLLIRLGAEELPQLGKSIVVDATVAALRLRGYEGSKSESATDGGSISNTFIDDVLLPYEKDIKALKLLTGSTGVQFL